MCFPIYGPKIKICPDLPQSHYYTILNRIMLNRRRLKRYPLQVRHKQDRGLILLLPQAAVGLQPGSDAGSDVVKTASSFVIQKPSDSCSMWCPMYAARY